MFDDVALNFGGVLSSQKRRTVQIVLSERCNLQCVYCYERTKDVSPPKFGVVTQIIANAFAETEEGVCLVFYFHGGEIALEFEFLKRVCEWMWGQSWPRRYMCAATTNGTLIHGAIKDWFWTHRDRFVLGISLDGTSRMHDMNRSGSYNQIDLDFFRSAWPQQPCKMTISRQSLPMLAEGIRHIHNLGFKVNANLAYDRMWTDELLSTYFHQLSICADYYLAHPDVEPTNLLSKKVWAVGLQGPSSSAKVARKWCGTGCHMVCYDMEGRRYPCQFFMPSSGVTNGEEALKDIDFNDAERFEDPACQGCPLQPICATCYGFNLAVNGDVRKRSGVLCKYRKVETVVMACMQGKMLLSGQKYALLRSVSPEKIPLLAKGVKTLYDGLYQEVRELCDGSRN